MKIDMTQSYKVVKFLSKRSGLLKFISSVTNPSNSKNSIWGIFDEQSLHNGYILVLKKSFKMGIFFNPQHTHPGKFDMKSPPRAGNSLSAGPVGPPEG